MNESYKVNLKKKTTELRKVRDGLQVAKDLEANVVAEYRNSMDFVTGLANRCNGGWSASMQYAKHTIPGIDQGAVEDSHGRRVFEILIDGETLNYGIIEADIANDDPCVEFGELEDWDVTAQEVPNTEAR